MPKGFGKNYFTLAAIQACTTSETLGRTSSCIHALCLKSQAHPREPREEEGENASELSAGPSHCDGHFRRRTRRIIKAFGLPNDSHKRIIAFRPSNSPPLRDEHPTIITNRRKPF